VRNEFRRRQREKSGCGCEARDSHYREKPVTIHLFVRALLNYQICPNTVFGTGELGRREIGAREIEEKLHISPVWQKKEIRESLNWFE
jgi:hypothetical protein